MKNQLAVLSPSTLSEFTTWGKASIEINDTRCFILHIEGIYDRFSITIFPNGKSYLNKKYFERCMGEGNNFNTFKTQLLNLFNTTCYDIDENADKVVGL